MSASNPQPDDLCNRCSHRRELHRPECHYNRPHGTPPDNVCRVGHPLIGPCPGFVETSETQRKAARAAERPTVTAHCSRPGCGTVITMDHLCEACRTEVERFREAGLFNAADAFASGAPEGPYVCPGCHAVAEPCAPGCIDAELAREREES